MTIYVHLNSFIEQIKVLKDSLLELSVKRSNRRGVEWVYFRLEILGGKVEPLTPGVSVKRDFSSV